MTTSQNTVTGDFFKKLNYRLFNAILTQIPKSFFFNLINGFKSQPGNKQARLSKREESRDITNFMRLQGLKQRVIGKEII